MIENEIERAVAIALAVVQPFQIREGHFAEFLLALDDVFRRAVDFLLLVVFIRRGERVENLVILKLGFDKTLLLGYESPILDCFHTSLSFTLILSGPRADYT